MKDHLQIKFSSPLEREYEGWIVHQIDRYFDRLKIDHAIWAVGPDQEKNWPADEHVSVGSKVFGLQFKRAKMAPGAIHENRLNWSLHHPAPQFGLVQANPEIFYCLPTFVNRDFRRTALHHCLFWRPGAVIDKNVWYNNPAAQTPYKNENSAPRWGLFVERLLHCDAGLMIEEPEDLTKLRNRLYRPSEQLEPASIASLSDTGLYLFAVQVGG